MKPCMGDFVVGRHFHLGSATIVDAKGVLEFMVKINLASEI